MAGPLPILDDGNAAPADFEQTLLLIPPIALITMLPISIAGWGVREATMMVAFGYAGLAQTDGTVVSILFGAVYFIVGGLGGLVWLAPAIGFALFGGLVGAWVLLVEILR